MLKIIIIFFKNNEIQRNNIESNQILLFNIERFPGLAEIVELCNDDAYVWELSNSEGYYLSVKLKNHKNSYLIDDKIIRPIQNLNLDEIYSNKVLNIEIITPELKFYDSELKIKAEWISREIGRDDLMAGDRRTFLGEKSIRVLEKY